MTNWHEYFRAHRERVEALADQPKDESKTIVTEAGHQIDSAELPKSIQRIFTTLESYGFDTRAGRSVTYTEALKTPEVVHYFVQARHDFGLKFSGWWEGGSFKGALYAENGTIHLLDQRQKERTGETLSVALKAVLERWGEQTCSFLL